MEKKTQEAINCFMLKDNLQKKKNILFWQIMGIGFSFMALFLFLSIKLYPQIILVGKSFLNKLESICGCANHFSFTHHPFIFSSLILAGLGLLLIFSFITVKAIRFRNSTKRFIKMNLRNKKNGLSPKLKKVIESLGLKNKVIETNDNKPVIFCFGFIKPRIIISASLTKRLSRKELRAVLLHEKYHLTVREPLKLFSVKLTTKILFFLPGLKPLSRQYKTFVELTADQKATNDFNDRIPLARALYKIIKWEEYLVKKNNLAVSFFGEITNERVCKLTDIKYTPRFKKLTPALSLSFSFVMFSFLLLSLIFSGQRAVADSKTGICQADKTHLSHQCHLEKDKPCIMSYHLLSNSCDM